MDVAKQLQYDYGTLDGVQADRVATNLTQLFWNSERERLVAWWLSATGNSDPAPSDYDKLRVLCEMMPALAGNPLKKSCERILREQLEIALPLKLENCDEIWRESAEKLLWNPISPRMLSADVAIPDVREICSAETLLATDEVELSAWQESLSARMEQKNKEGFRRVLLRIPSGYSFSEPDPYHVGIALRQKGNAEWRGMLIAQGVRMLCRACVAYGWSLQLELGAHAEEAVALLSYAERTVGLPVLAWSTPYADTRDAMLAFGYQPHARPVFPLIRLADHPTDGELRNAIESYAARVPLGALCFACGGDARDNTMERERLLEALKKMESENRT